MLFLSAHILGVTFYGEQGADKPAGNSSLFDVDFACLPRQLQLRLKVCFLCYLFMYMVGYKKHAAFIFTITLSVVDQF